MIRTVYICFNILDHSYISVHNNFIIGTESKIYRAKEMLFFTVDYDSYYTSENNKYISTVINTTNISDIETILYVLLTVGNRTNRIFILPSFPCNLRININFEQENRRCNFLKYWKIEALNKYYSNKYREYSFVYNRLVPNIYKDSVYINVKNDSINNVMKLVTNELKYIVIIFESVFNHFDQIQGIKRK